MKTFHERFPEVPSTETVLLELYCNYIEDGSKSRGRLYITPRRIAFHSMIGNFKKVILLEEIKDVKKTDLGFIALGIDLITAGSVVSFFILNLDIFKRNLEKRRYI